MHEPGRGQRRACRHVAVRYVAPLQSLNWIKPSSIKTYSLLEYQQTQGRTAQVITRKMKLERYICSTYACGENFSCRQTHKQTINIQGLVRWAFIRDNCMSDSRVWNELCRIMQQRSSSYVTRGKGQLLLTISEKANPSADKRCGGENMLHK